jgi:carbonic anhydrase
MSKILDEVLAANAAYAAAIAVTGELAVVPWRGFAILTCMDARLDPAKYAGLREGEAHVIRNAGGRASDDAIRSLVISVTVLGTTEVFVIHHTDCRMASITDEGIRGLLATSGGSWAADEIDWLTMSSATGAVVDDVRRIKGHPLVPARIPVYGFIFDVQTGALTEVPEASAAGKAT